MSPTTTKQSVPSSPPKRMTVAEFEQLADLLGDDRVELIDGHIVGRGEMKPAHVLATELAKCRIVVVFRIVGSSVIAACLLIEITTPQSVSCNVGSDRAFGCQARRWPG